MKHLGGLLDNKLSWKPHVKKVKTRLQYQELAEFYLNSNITQHILC